MRKPTSLEQAIIKTLEKKEFRSVMQPAIRKDGMITRVGKNRLLVAALRNTHPEWSLRQIANEIGISKQRVHVILTKLGLPTSKSGYGKS